MNSLTSLISLTLYQVCAKLHSSYRNPVSLRVTGRFGVPSVRESCRGGSKEGGPDDVRGT